MRKRNLYEARPIDYLRNYEKISELCHRSGEPVCLTGDGKTDLVSMSIEAYEWCFGPVDLNGNTE